MLKLIITLISSFIVSNIAQNCGLIVPADPLSAQGLATPYILTSLDPANPCSILNPNTAVFVEATILDNDNGNLFVYHPLVVDNLNQIAIQPITPNIPMVSTIGLWFGSNAEVTNLIGTVSPITGINSLQQGNCVNGLPNSNFGQFAYCNAVKFFNVANTFINVGLIKVPLIGNTLYGVPCPTTRHFAIVDQDQSDNVISSYIITNTLQVAQNTAANRKNLTVLGIVGNGSDNRLLDIFIDPAIGCKSFTAPDLADPNSNLPSLALNELFASQLGINNNVAIVPSGDPMCLFNDAPNLQKLNLYRQGVNQPVIQNLDPNNNLNYCNQMGQIAGPFLALHSLLLTASQSPDPNVGNNLFNFMANRFFNSWNILNCVNLNTNQSPITVTLDQNGVAIGNNINEVFGIGTLPPQKANTNTNTGIPLAAIIVVSVLLLISIIINIVLPIYYSNKKDSNDKLFEEKYGDDKPKDTDIESTKPLNSLETVELNNKN